MILFVGQYSTGELAASLWNKALVMGWDKVLQGLDNCMGK
jgi:hypothetical protein